MSLSVNSTPNGWFTAEHFIALLFNKREGEIAGRGREGKKRRKKRGETRNGP
jgi:hypothetical protein